MITVTLQEAKATLNHLVEKAISGEDIILMRGAKVVARIQPITENDLEVTSRLTDAQAEHFWDEVKESSSEKFKDVRRAIQHLRK